MIQSQASKQKNILVVEDHKLFRGMLVQLINKELDMTVCGEADSIGDAKILINETLPDLVVLDLTLRGASGLELTKYLKAMAMKLPVLVISMHDETVYAERALHAGARGYISKQVSPSEVIKAMRKVLSGNIYVSEHVAESVLEKIGKTDNAIAGIGSLSCRELEVFQHIGRGLNSREIAELLNVGISTVDSYRARIKSKLKISNSVELHQNAGQWVADHCS